MGEKIMAGRGLLLTGAAMAAVLSWGSGALAAEAGETKSKVATEVETIVVTAERRNESAQDVPVSVTAIGQEQIERQFLHNLADFTRAAPNFTIEGVGSVSRSSAVVYSRGIGFSGIDNGEPPVGISIDGLSYFTNVGTLLNTYDTAQIEVLQGPQGTLFGRNTTGGVINIRTNDPGPDYEVNGKVRVGNYGRFNTNVTANLPLTDSLALRVSANTQQSDGFFRNLYVDPVSGSRQGDTHAGGDNSRAIRGKLQWKATEDLTLKLTAFYTRQRQDVPVGQNGNGPNDVLYSRGPINANSSVAGRPGVGYPGGPTDVRTVRRDTDGADNLDQKGFIFDTHYRTPWGFDVTTISTYLKYRSLQIADFDATDLNFFTSNLHTGRSQQSQEIRFASNATDSPLQWQGGVYYFSTRHHNYQTNVLGPSFFANTGASSPTVTQALATATYARSLAAFAQVDYRIMDKFVLTAGARYTTEKKRITNWPSLPNLNPPFGAGISNQKTWDDIIYKFAARYEVNDDLMAYASYSTGKKAGGFSASATTLSQLSPYAPEEAKSMEAGIKSEWLNKRLRVNLTAFNTKYDNLQVGAFRPVPGGSGQQSFIANDAFERAKGVELRATALPIPGLELNASVGYLHARYTSFVSALSYNFPGHVCNGLTGGPGSPPIAQDHSDPASACYLLPPRSPKWTAKLEAAYNVDLGDWGVLTPHVAWSYEGAHVTNLTNAPQGFQGRYSITDVDITYEDPQDRYRISAFVHNLTNKTHLINANPIAGLFNANYYADPRVTGIELAVKFR
jgi:iron complex outermembrane receptor protein